MRACFVHLICTKARLLIKVLRFIPNIIIVCLFFLFDSRHTIKGKNKSIKDFNNEIIKHTDDEKVKKDRV